jgi:hypothetical protein
MCLHFFKVRKDIQLLKDAIFIKMQRGLFVILSVDFKFSKTKAYKFINLNKRKIQSAVNLIYSDYVIYADSLNKNILQILKNPDDAIYLYKTYLFTYIQIKDIDKFT